MKQTKRTKQTKRFLAVLFAVSLCLGCTACGTSVADNTGIYFDQVSTVLGNLFNSGNVANSNTSHTTASSGTQLAAPKDFTVDTSGNYSFSGSEGAEYYLLYFCAPDATSDEDSFLYSSSPIKDDGSGIYSGQCADLFDYAYGEYLVKVYAFPDLTDSSHSMSTAATSSYSFSGTQSAPEIYYYWNTFDGTMGVQVANMDTYLYESYPDKVDVIFTNTANNSDVVTITIDNVSPNNYGAVSDALTRGATYDVTAVATSESAYVTNPTSDTTTVASALLLGDCHQFTLGYYYYDGFANDIFKWPIVGENFDPETGGEIGSAIGGFGGVTVFSVSPVETSAGSAYSYELTVGAMMPLTGRLELYPDGTFKANDEGFGPFQTSVIGGTWVDNGDGTLTLNYDHSNIDITT